MSTLNKGMGTVIYRVNRGPKPKMAESLKGRKYCCIIFYQLTSIWVTSLLNAIAEVWVILHAPVRYCIRKFLHFL